MEFQLGHIISIAVMDLIGICVNSWFLYTVKTRAFHLNAIDILQACKTVLCLVALLVCVWTEFVTCTSKVCTGAKEISDVICYYSTCLTFLAIAYVRYKACEYRGQASVLLTHRYAIKTLLICFTPVGMFTAAILSLMFNNRNVDASVAGYGVNITQYTETEILTGECKIAYKICLVTFLIIIPIFISVVLYLRVCNTVTRAAKATEHSMSNRKHDPSKLITSSITVLLSTMFTVWGIYTIVRIVSLFAEVNEMFFIYWKLVVLIVQPSWEGILQKSGKKSAASQGRSTRQIYPVDSGALSACISEDIDNTTGAGKLPVVFEESENQAKTSNNTLDDRTVTDVITNNKKTVRVTRKSFIHPRASVLIRNAATIGLEYQSKTNCADFQTQRKISEERLRTELFNIDEDAFHMQRKRRLSNCLRFTAASDSSWDEIYYSYRDLYARRGSKYSEKNRKSSSDTSNISDPEQVPHGRFNRWMERKKYASGLEHESPSLKRWRKLYTTARTARKFSKIEKDRSHAVREEEPPDITEKKSSDLINKDILRRHDAARDSMQNASKLDLDKKRLGSDGNLTIHLASEPKMKGSKKRSISCVSNVWMKNNPRTPDRKKSVSFMPTVELDGPSTSNKEPALTKSISYDSEIYLSHKEFENKKTKIRHSYDHEHIKTDIKERENIEKWLIDRATTREECIVKLMEMKEYF